jgi:hypothetical protein
MSNIKQDASQNLLSIAVISQATKGDRIAMEVILKRCQGYIFKLSLTKVYCDGYE